MDTAVIPAVCRGRPREFDIDEALTAALRVFWRYGFEGASMTELTQAMGITKPSLYAAFGNKEDLFRKALDLYDREKLAYMQTALDAPTAREVAERLLRGALAMNTSTCDPKGCLAVMSAVSGSPGSETMRNEVIARRKKGEARLVARFAEAREGGDLPADADPAALARYVIAIMQGMSLQASAGATCAELEQLVGTSLAMWPAA